MKLTESHGRWKVTTEYSCEWTCEGNPKITVGVDGTLPLHRERMMVRID